MDTDKVFKALGDPTRRKLLDLLCEKNGQTLGQLCENLDMARQSATQHLEILEAANLVSTVKRGREKLHFINPVPLYEVYERWVRKFEHQRLSLLHDPVAQRFARNLLIAFIPAVVFGLSLGAVIKRPLLVGLVFAFGWEQVAMVVPGYLRRFTVAYYLQGLVPHAMPADEGVTSLLQSVFTETPSVALSLLMLALITVVSLFLATRVIERREYVLEQ